ncbi:Arginyl-tRNA--protein transferase 1 [Dimargaris cristalligena]|nr:Arginyl-tRNA--protein transferase 1 [Dimargaris cristalligena]
MSTASVPCPSADLQLSTVYPMGWQNSPCGYCHQKESTNRWYTAHASQLSARDYQDLVNHNWRRSGHLLYRRDMLRSCCPTFTIRLNTHLFRPSRTNRKTVNKVNRYLRCPPEAAPGDVPLTKPQRSTVLPQSLPPRRQRTADPNNMYMRKYVDFGDCVMDGSNQESNPDILQRLTVVTQPAKFEEEAYDVFLRYQKSVHSDDVGKWNKDTYTNFLCQSPIQFESFDGTTPFPDELSGLDQYGLSDNEGSVGLDDPCASPLSRSLNSLSSSSTVTSPICSTKSDADYAKITAYGSYHQKYYLNSTLIAVGVIDILPLSVSSVYLFYEPKFAFLGLGRYCAVREAIFAKRLQAAHPHLLRELNYYNMGYYIHSCPKMNYKGDYRPSELLDPVTYEWHSLASVLPILNDQQHTSFSAHPSTRAAQLHSLAPSMTPWYQRLNSASAGRQPITRSMAQALQLPPLGFLLPSEMPAEVWDGLMVEVDHRSFPAGLVRARLPWSRAPLDEFYSSIGHKLAARMKISLNLTPSYRALYEASVIEDDVMSQESDGSDLL